MYVAIRRCAPLFSLVYYLYISFRKCSRALSCSYLRLYDKLSITPSFVVSPWSEAIGSHKIKRDSITTLTLRSRMTGKDTLRSRMTGKEKPLTPKMLAPYRGCFSFIRLLQSEKQIKNMVFFKKINYFSTKCKKRVNSSCFPHKNIVK